MKRKGLFKVGVSLRQGLKREIIFCSRLQEKTHFKRRRSAVKQSGRIFRWSLSKDFWIAAITWEGEDEDANRGSQQKIGWKRERCWLLPGKIARKVSTLAAGLDRGVETQIKKKQKNSAGFYLCFRLRWRQKRTDILRPIRALLSVSSFEPENAVVMDTHFHKNSSRASFLLFLSDDLYVPNLNVNPAKIVLM